MIESGWWSFTRLISIDVKPKTAFVTWPPAVAMSVGRAKKARYVKELPSRRRILDTAGSPVREQLAVEHELGDVLHPDPVVHGPLLDEREGVRLRQSVDVHQPALGPVDQLAGLQPLLERADFSTERLQFGVAGVGQLERGHEVALLERLDQVGQRAASRACSMSSRWLNAVRISTPQSCSSTMRRAASRPSMPGIPMSSTARSGRSSRAISIASSPRPVSADDVVALLLEGLPQVEPDDGLVLGDEHAQSHGTIEARGCDSPLLRRDVRGSHLGANRPCDRRTATRRDLCSEGDALGGQAINSSSRASWRSSSSAIDVSTSWRRAAIAAAWRSASWCSRSAKGVSETSERMRASSASSASCANCSSMTASSSRKDRSRCPTPERRRSTSHFVIAGSVDRGPMDAWGSHGRLLGRGRRVAHHRRGRPPGTSRGDGRRGGRPPWAPYWSIRHGEAHHLQSLCEVLLEDGTQLPALAQLPPDLPVGYHQLLPTDGGPATRLVVAPRSCPAPPRAWGWSAQLYALHSDWTWGTGDLGDLKDLVRWTGSLGGGAVLVNPLHANCQRSPSSPARTTRPAGASGASLYVRVADVPGATLVAAISRLLTAQAEH